MLIKAYIDSSGLNALYEARQLHSNCRVYHADQMSEREVLDLHYYDLFYKSTEVRCIVNMDCIKNEILLEHVDKVKTNVIWVFKKLASNTKLYKRIEKIAQVEKVQDISSVAVKKKFITTLAKKHRLDDKYVTLLLDYCSDLAFEIEDSVVSLAESLKTVSEEEALKHIGIYESDVDLLNFSVNLFYDMEKAFFYADKLASNSVSQFQAVSILTKRLQSFILLSINEVEAAKKYWNDFGYRLRDSQIKARSIGFHNLLELHNFIDITLSELDEDKDIRYQLNLIVKKVWEIIDHS